VRSEGHTLYPLLEVVDAVQFLPSGDLPQAERHILATGQRQRAVGGEGDAEDPARVSLEQTGFPGGNDRGTGRVGCPLGPYDARPTGRVRVGIAVLLVAAAHQEDHHRQQAEEGEDSAAHNEADLLCLVSVVRGPWSVATHDGQRITVLIVLNDGIPEGVDG